jgi:hypothetical protein
VFDDRRFALKLVLALAAAALLGLHSWKEARAINPSSSFFMARPDLWSGTDVWLSAHVVESGPGGFTVDSNGLRIRVEGAASVRPGDAVSLTGTFRAEGPRIELREVRKLSPHARYRWIAEAVSLGVLALVLWNFLRHFAFRPQALQIGGRD